MPEHGWVFPCGISLDGNGQMSVFPAAEVLFPTGRGDQVAFLMLVDSGARISALPKFDAEVLGIEAESGVPSMVAGISGKAIRGWKHDIPAILGREECTIPVTFLDVEEAPRVLGREAVFERFTIVFQEQKRRTGFLENGLTQTQTVDEILSHFQQEDSAEK